MGTKQIRVDDDLKKVLEEVKEEKGLRNFSDAIRDIARPEFEKKIRGDLERVLYGDTKKGSQRS